MAGDSDNKRTKRTIRKYFRCGSGDHLIRKFLKPPKEIDKRLKQVCLSERGNRSSQKECDNVKNNNDRKIYASMARMYDNYKYPSKDFGDSSQ